MVENSNDMQQNVIQSALDHAYNYISSVINTDLSTSKRCEYDDESFYWSPSNEEKELMSQFNQLKIQSIPHKELKYVRHL